MEQRVLQVVSPPRYKSLQNSLLSETQTVSLSVIEAMIEPYHDSPQGGYTRIHL